MHPSLYLPLAAAILGAPVIFLLTAWVFKRRERLTKPVRYAAFAGLVLIECAYWGGVYAFFVEPNLLEVRRQEIASPHWRGPPLTVAAVSDIHIASPHMNVARVEDLVRRINALDADVIVLLGDYVGDNGPTRPPRIPKQCSRVSLCWAPSTRRSASTPSSATTTLGGTKLASAPPSSVETSVC